MRTGLLLRIPKEGGMQQLERLCPPPVACTIVLVLQRTAVTIGVSLACLPLLYSLGDGAGTTGALAMLAMLARRLSYLGVILLALVVFGEYHHVRSTYATQLSSWRRLELLMPEVSRNVWGKIDKSWNDTSGKIQKAAVGMASTTAANAAFKSMEWLFGRAATRAV